MAWGTLAGEEEPTEEDSLLHGKDHLVTIEGWRVKAPDVDGDHSDPAVGCAILEDAASLIAHPYARHVRWRSGRGQGDSPGPPSTAAACCPDSRVILMWYCGMIGLQS